MIHALASSGKEDNLHHYRDTVDSMDAVDEHEVDEVLKTLSQFEAERGLVSNIGRFIERNKNIYGSEDGTTNGDSGQV